VHRLAALVSAVAAATAPPRNAVFRGRRRSGRHPDGRVVQVPEQSWARAPRVGPQCVKAGRVSAPDEGQKLVPSIDDATAVVGPRRQGVTAATWCSTSPVLRRREYALTSGAPSHTDAAGNPVMPLLRVNGKAPDGDVDRLARMLSAHQLRIEVVLPRRAPEPDQEGGGAIQGVKAKLLALRVSNGPDRRHRGGLDRPLNARR